MKDNTGKGFYTLLLSFVVLCMIPQFTKAETYQRVIVKEYIPDVNNPTLNATKIPLPNVEVSVKGAGSTVTDQEGSCTLRFNLMKGGDKIIVRQFARPGYELLNPELLNDLVIRRDDKPLEIVMISQENAIKLSRIISRQVGAQFEKMRLRELNELDILAVDYDTKRKAIIEKYEAKLDDVDQYIDRLVRVDITRVTEQESIAFQAFNDGNLEQALQILEDENLIQQYRSTIESLNAIQSAHAKVDEERDEQLQSQKDIQYFLKTQITMLEMEGSEKSMRKAKSLLEQLLEIDPFGQFQGKEYMSVILQLKDYDFAKHFLQKYLDDEEISPVIRYRLAINLATILFEERKFDEVMQLLLPFEDVMEEIYEQRSDEPLYLYLPVLAQQMLGHCEKVNGNRSEAVIHLRKMFETYLKLRKVDALTKFYANVTYPRLIRGMRDLNDMEEWDLSMQLYNAAYPRVEELYSNGSLRERFLWSRYRFGKAIVLMKQNQLDEGMKIVFEIMNELDYIHSKNRPMSRDYYQFILMTATNYYYDARRYAEMKRTAQKWFEVVDIPYDSSMVPPLHRDYAEDELEDYKNVCYMYKTASDQMPKNP